MVKFHTGETEHGWSNFDIHIDSQHFACNTSYLEDSPISQLLRVAENYIDPNGRWTQYIILEQEPSAYLMKFDYLEDDRVEVSLYFSFIGFPPDMSKEGEWKRVMSWSHLELLHITKMSLSIFCHAVFDDACEVLYRYGVLGFREAWDSSHRLFDDESDTFSMENFFCLARYIKKKGRDQKWTFQDELVLMNEINEKFSKIDSGGE